MRIMEETQPAEQTIHHSRWEGENLNICLDEGVTLTFVIILTSLKTIEFFFQCINSDLFL